MRYDAAIIGAGADGLAAATRLARAGLSVAIVDRESRAGGLLATREFQSGFRASAFLDELPPMPAPIFWELGLAQRGVLFLAPRRDAVVDESRGAIDACGTGLETAVHDHLAGRLAASDAAARDVPPRFALFHRAQPKPRLDPWGERSLLEAVADNASGTALVARALEGRAADPFLRGTALHLLALRGSGEVVGGLGRLGDAMTQVAREAGVAFALGVEATHLEVVRDRVTGVGLADGTTIGSRAVLSTLDLKRTVLSLLEWKSIPQDVVTRAAQFRHAPALARLLVALETDAAVPRSRFHLNAAPQKLAVAYAQWRSGILPEAPPMTLRFVSAADPSLAPRGAVSATVTLGAIPRRLFDGSWTREKRGLLADTALATISLVLPGARIVGHQLLLAEDFEQTLGATDGDLDGGEIASDQIFERRAYGIGPRTPLQGLYLAGPSSAIGPHATAASGWLAAAAIQADLRAGRLK